MTTTRDLYVLSMPQFLPVFPQFTSLHIELFNVAFILRSFCVLSLNVRQCLLISNETSSREKEKNIKSVDLDCVFRDYTKNNTTNNRVCNNKNSTTQVANNQVEQQKRRTVRNAVDDTLVEHECESLHFRSFTRSFFFSPLCAFFFFFHCGFCLSAQFISHSDSLTKNP